MASERPLNSIYIHIPFCKNKCYYCNFVSYTNKQHLIQDYFRALEQEISISQRDLTDKIFSTVYIGGGTPSLIDGFFYEKILSLLNIKDSAETTIEVNPGTVSREYLNTLKSIGFNRLSIGVQCFDNEILKVLNRPHTAGDAIKTVQDAKNAGFDNISVDLIYGLPGQTLHGWKDTLYQAINLDIKHISAYGLKIEEDTEFFRNLPKNLPDDELAAEMYLNSIEILKINGFEHYEISNFARPGFESRHNLAYWKNKEYFGFGVAAHGYVNRVRYENSIDLQSYINNPIEKESKKELNPREIIEEAIFMGLRLRKGIEFSEFEKNYSVNLREKYREVIEKHVNRGLVNFDDRQLRLTEKGILLSNDVFADFLDYTAR